MMDKNRIRHVLVEDTDHRLVGVVSYRSVLRLSGFRSESRSRGRVTVGEVMHARSDHRGAQHRARWKPSRS